MKSKNFIWVMAGVLLLSMCIAVVPASATVTLSGSHDTLVLGHACTFSGSNNETSTTFLFITGPNLPAEGAMLQSSDPANNPVIDNNAGTFTQADVSSGNYTLLWDTLGSALDPGTYTVYAVREAHDRNNLSGVSYATFSIILKKPFSPVTIVAAGDLSYYFGEQIHFFGNNTAGSTTYLFIIGPGLPAQGAQLNTAPASSPVTDNNTGTFTQAGVSGSYWSFDWQPAETIALDAGTYTIYAEEQPHDRDHVIIDSYDTVSIILKKPFISATVLAPGHGPVGHNFTIQGTKEGAHDPVYFTCTDNAPPALTGNLPADGVKPEDFSVTSVTGNPTTFGSTTVNTDGSFSYSWDTSSISGGSVIPGKTYGFVVMNTPVNIIDALADTYPDNYYTKLAIGIDGVYADYTADKTSCTAPCTISFTDVSTGIPPGVMYDDIQFGDGLNYAPNSSGWTISHTYSAGTFIPQIHACNGATCDTRTGATITVNPSPAPTVTSITPNFGVVDTGSVVITDLAGTGFISGATVKLTKTGQSDIIATNIVTTPTMITCDFDVTGAATGSWNVVVTNPDSQTGTLTNGFAVMPTDRDGAVDHGVDTYLGGNKTGNGQQWLQTSDTVIPPSTTITFLDGSTLVTPDDVPVWIVFVDEDKQASYGHPCKLDLYFDDTTFIEHDVQFPPTEVNGIPIELTYGAGKAPNAGGLTSTEPPYIQDPNCNPDPLHNYAVLISGGGTNATNYARYYNDIKFLYNTLVKDYKYDRTHIRVVMSDGTDDAADQVMYDANNAASTINSEQNLDNVPATHPANDVNYAATTKTNVQTALNYWGPLTSSDSLLIFTTGHGEKVTDSGGDTNSNDVNLLLWGSGVKVTDTEFVSYLPANPKITLVMEQCYGGGIKDEYIVSSVSNRVLTTAAKGNQASHGNDFSYFWITAAAGHDSAIPTPNPANADTSNNAQVSANEAYTYANFRDPSGPYGAQTENPVYNSYVSGGGDSQYLSACTNPYSITPNTPGTWTYPTSNPVTVTWTRGGFSSPYPNVKVELWKGTGNSALLQKTIATSKGITLQTSGSWNIPSTLPGGPGSGYWIKISTIAPFVPTIVGASGSFTINNVTASGTGNPTITSDPTDALIEITDSAGQPVYIGGVLQTGYKTLHTFTGLAAGSYLVKVSKSCYWPMNPTLITVAGGGSSATFGPYRLIAMPSAGSVCINDAPFGSIAITSEPEEGYWVSIDGGAMAYNTPVLQDIGVGPHSVTLDMPGYLSQTQDVIVKAGELTTAHFVLVPVTEGWVVGDIIVPAEPVPVGTEVQVSSMVTYLGEAYPLTAAWTWGAGAPVTTETDGPISPVTASHTYTTPGIYTVSLFVTDSADTPRTATKEATSFIVVYDPTGRSGFVTGGGWIDSPAGSYMANPALSGKATFGFVSNYLKGAKVPTGNTEFRFEFADLNFHSDACEWLVVNKVNQKGIRAQYKGVGTINGAGKYNFMIWGFDGSPDTFRIKLWTESNGIETVIYDNGKEMAIGGGSIIIRN